MARMDLHNNDPEWSFRIQMEEHSMLFETSSPLDCLQRPGFAWIARARPIRKKVTRKIRNSQAPRYRLWIT
jgi:hypothetical protein